MKFSLFNFSDLRKPKESKLFLALIPTFKEKKTRQFTTISLTFITIAFFGFFAIGPTFGTITDLQKQLDDSKFVNDSLQKKISNLTILQTQYSDIEPNLTPLYDAVPTGPGLDTFVGQIHQLAQQTNIQLNRVQTLPIDISLVTEQSPYLGYAFTIEAQGDLVSLQKYMSQIGDINRIITFDTIDFTRVGRIDQTYRITLRGETYFKSSSTL